ncbi:MAG: hypothetical protein D6775_08140 [Caldilineae bacterium]|nr:MAG: hypothetical protein D6775_08140 [Caldilineae bacterium]
MSIRWETGQMSSVLPQSMRQEGLLPPPEELGPTVLVGAGAVGSCFLRAAAHLLPNFTVFDSDTVKLENVETGMFSLADYGKTKVMAASWILMRSGVRYPQVNAYGANAGERTGRDVVCGFDGRAFRRLIICTDNMQSRRDIYRGVVRAWASVWQDCEGDLDNLYSEPLRYVIDARVGLRQAQVYVVQRDEILDQFARLIPKYRTAGAAKAALQRWVRREFSLDGEGINEPCGASMSPATAMIAAGMIVHTIGELEYGYDVPRLRIVGFQSESQAEGFYVSRAGDAARVA